MSIIAMSVAVVAAWIVLGPPAAFAVTVGAGRLLGCPSQLAGAGGRRAGGVDLGRGRRWGHHRVGVGRARDGPTGPAARDAVHDDRRSRPRPLAPMGSLASGEEAGLLNVRNPLAGVRDAVRPVRRYREVLHLARVNGVTTHRPDPATLPAGVRQTLEQAGGVLVKVGQVASTRPDLLPVCVVRRARAPPRSRGACTAGGDPPDLDGGARHRRGGGLCRVRLAADCQRLDRPGLRRPAARRYERRRQGPATRPRRNDRPGQCRHHAAGGAHRAAYNPRPVACGRPNSLPSSSTTSERSSTSVSKPPTAMHSSSPWRTPIVVRVPAVFPTLSTHRVLTEERIGGCSITDTDTLTSLGLDPSEIARRLVDAFVAQIFDAGVFHSDPHPGNILVEDDGTIVLIDLGAVEGSARTSEPWCCRCSPGRPRATPPCCDRRSPR